MVQIADPDQCDLDHARTTANNAIQNSTNSIGRVPIAYRL
jgi:hypothetical protein